MTRPIKFRGKRLTDGQWVYGEFFHNRGKAFIAQDGVVENPLASWRDYNVQPETVGQFTGLFDAVGKEIYEGDVVTSITENSIGVVQWGAEQAAFIVQMKNSIQWYFLSRTYKVIGNIHDNPSLLTPQ